MSGLLNTSATIAALPLACAALLIATACGEDSITGPAFEADAPFSLSAQLTTQTRFRLDGINSSITVTGVSSSNSVLVSGARIVGANSLEEAEQHLDDLQVQLSESAEEILVRTTQPPTSDGLVYRVEYNVTVPRDLEVVIENGNGDIDLVGMAANVFVTLGNGEVNCACTLPLDGTIDIDAGNGAIELTIPQNSSAQLSAMVGNGEVSVSNLVLENASITPRVVTGRLGDGRGEISLALGNGTIIVRGS